MKSYQVLSTSETTTTREEEREQLFSPSHDMQAQEDFSKCLEALGERLQGL